MLIQRIKLFFLFSSLLLVASSCASSSTGKIKAIENTPSSGITQKANNLSVTLFPINTEDPGRQQFYEEFTQKGFLPLQITIFNPTDHFYSFEKVQYAICDPQFKRTRRIDPKDMALMNSQILYSKNKGFFWKRLKGFFAKKKLKQEYKKFEFTTTQISPQTEITGWLYFKVKEGEFDPNTFLEALKGYKLEIAHIKEVQTNIVNNIYLELDSLKNPPPQAVPSAS